MTEIKPWEERAEELTHSPYVRTAINHGCMLKEIAELRAALAKAEQGKPVAQVSAEEIQWRNIRKVVYALADLCFGSKDDPKWGIPYIAITNSLTAKDGIRGIKLEPLPHTHPVRPMSETTAWLIELNIANAPCWLTGTGAYTNDANEALQFVREIDAKAMLDVYMGTKFGKEIIGIYRRHFAPENYRVTEHIFLGIKGATE